MEEDLTRTEDVVPTLQKVSSCAEIQKQDCTASGGFKRGDDSANVYSFNSSAHAQYICLLQFDSITRKVSACKLCGHGLQTQLTVMRSSLSHLVEQVYPTIIVIKFLRFFGIRR